MPLDPVLIAAYREAYWAEARRVFDDHLEHERRRELSDEEQDALEDADHETWRERMRSHCAARDAQEALLSAARGPVPADLAADYEEHGDE